MRAISNDLDKRLVDRTVELAKSTGGFGWKQLRVALDSSPLHGIGRVEDTWNLIGRAMSKVVHAVSLALDVNEDTVIQSAKLSVLTADSFKAALDIDWNDEDKQLAALQTLLRQVDALEQWVMRRAAKEAEVPPLKDSLDTLRSLVKQDIEPDPSGAGRRIKEEVAKDRIISVADREMRHGRKNKTRLFNGYKRHIVIANGIILGTAVVPANVQEHAVAARLLEQAAEHGDISIVDIGRGYLSSPAIEQLYREGTLVNTRAWVPTNKGRFTKNDFRIDLRRRLVTCPNGVSVKAQPSGKAEFAVEDCGRCKLKPACTTAKHRSITLHPMEELLVKLRRRAATRKGRAELRQRIASNTGWLISVQPRAIPPATSAPARTSST